MRVHFAFALSACVLAACHSSPVQEAQVAFDHGNVSRAQNILTDEVRKHPENKEARLLLARVRMRLLKPDDVTLVLAPLVGDAEYAPRIAKAYADEVAHASRPPWSQQLTRYAVEATRFDPTRKQQMCQALLAFTRRYDFDRARVAQVAASIDEPCKSAALRALRSWIENDNLSNFYQRKFEIEATAKTAVQIDPTAANDIAHALRDLAQRAAATDHNHALQLLDIAYRIDPAVHGELETAVLRSHLTDATISAARQLQLQYTGSEIEVTKRIMGMIGSVISQYAGEHNRAPLATNFDELESALKSYLRAPLPRVDGWGSAFEYISSRDSRSGRLISGGADRHIDDASRRLNGSANGVVVEYGADLIWEDGHFIQQPDEGVLHQYDASPVTQH